MNCLQPSLNASATLQCTMDAQIQRFQFGPARALTLAFLLLTMPVLAFAGRGGGWTPPPPPVCENLAPVARITVHPADGIHVGDTVYLSGEESSDDYFGSEELIYDWQVEHPGGATATTSNSGFSNVLYASEAGQYVIRLQVREPEQGEEAEEEQCSIKYGFTEIPLSVETGNAPPVANAGVDQASYVGGSVELNGNGSSDPDGDRLNFSWELTETPQGSLAALSGAGSSMPSFSPDVPGTYTAELVVNDGFVDSGLDTTQITAISVEDYVEVLLMDAINLTGELPKVSFKTEGNRRALIAHLSSVIKALQTEKPETAASHLERAVSRTDGCAMRGEPDSGGALRRSEGLHPGL